MVVKYQNANQNISLENIRHILKVISEIISKPSKYILDKLTPNSSNTKNNFQQDSQKLINENKLKLYNSMDSLSNSLKDNKMFYEEYFDFCEIQDMIKDTLNRDYALIENSDLKFILELITDFSQLINYKIDLIENDEFNEDEFKLKYNSYLTSFNNSQIYFYEHICNESLDDDLFTEYTNIIVE